MTERELGNLELLERDADFIKRWFQDTIALIEQQVHPQDPGDMLCVTAMAVSSNYAKAIMDMLRLDHHMPTKALLRVLCELSSKLAWCMMTTKTHGKNKKMAVEKKIQQWEKNSLYKKMNIMQEFRYIVPPEKRRQLEDNIADTKQKIRKIHCSPMPRTVEIFYRLSRRWRASIYTRGYLQFNDAIHIDLGTLASTVNKEGHRININFDTSEDISELSGYCVSFMYQINYIVRSHFGWDTKKIANELHQLGKERIPII